MIVNNLSDIPRFGEKKFATYSKNLLDKEPNNKQQMALSNIIFLDIESIREQKSYDDMPQKQKELWVKKATRYIKYENEADYTSESPEDLYYEKGGLFPEYARVCCITVGFLNKEKQFIKYSFVGEEKVLLENFCKFISILEVSNYNKPPEEKKMFVLGGTIKYFDIPFLFRRLLKHKLHPPKLIFGEVFEKPWEKRIIDIQDIWRCGTRLGDATMNTICFMLGVESPKKTMDGSKVSSEFYDNDNIIGIAGYCEDDVQSLYDCCVVLTELGAFSLTT